MTSDDIIITARSFIGTPFRHQGRIPGMSLDCAGMVVAVASSLGMEFNDVLDYGRNPTGALLESTLDGQPCLERVPAIADRQPGDVLLMKFAREPQHVAITTGDTIIHSYQQVGQVCEHRLSDVWAARIVRVYRFRGLA